MPSQSHCQTIDGSKLEAHHKSETPTSNKKTSFLDCWLLLVKLDQQHLRPIEQNNTPACLVIKKESSILNSSQSHFTPQRTNRHLWKVTTILGAAGNT